LNQSESLNRESKILLGKRCEGLSTQKNPRTPSDFFKKIPKKSQKLKKIKKIKKSKKSQKSQNSKIPRMGFNKSNKILQKSIFFVIDSNSPYCVNNSPWASVCLLVCLLQCHGHARNF
jgi:hypothetical protein